MAHQEKGRGPRRTLGRWRAVALGLGLLMASVVHAPARATAMEPVPEIRIGLIYRDPEVLSARVQAPAEAMVAFADIPGLQLAWTGERYVRAAGYGHLISKASSAAEGTALVQQLRSQGLRAYFRMEWLGGEPVWLIYTGPYADAATALREAAQHQVAGEAVGPYGVSLLERYETAEEAQVMADAIRLLGLVADVRPTADGWQVTAGQAADPTGLDEIRFLLEEAGIPTGDVVGGDTEAMQWVTTDGVVTELLPVPFSLSSAEPLALNGKRYRGALDFASLSPLLVVNRLDIETYLRGVVPYEMPASWHPEALKAQAVAARTYALANLGRYADWGFDCLPTTGCQVYGGADGERPETDAAILATRGEVLTYEGRLANTVFHAHSGGHTAAGPEVWYADVPYWRPKPDPGASPASSWDAWERFRTFSWLDQHLRADGAGIGTLQRLVVNGYTPSGRLESITVIGTHGEKTYKGDSTRWLLDLPSSRGRVVEQRQTAAVLTAAGLKQATQAGTQVLGRDGSRPVTEPRIAVDARGEKLALLAREAGWAITGSGWGHGVGLSQYGANYQAQQGRTYWQILGFYYEGTTLTQGWSK